MAHKYGHMGLVSGLLVTIFLSFMMQQTQIFVRWVFYQMIVVELETSSWAVTWNVTTPVALSLMFCVSGVVLCIVQSVVMPVEAGF